MGWVVNVASRPFYPPGKTRYPLYRRLGVPQGRFGRVRENLAPHRDSIPGPSNTERVAIPTEPNNGISSHTMKSPASGTKTRHKKQARCKPSRRGNCPILLLSGQDVTHGMLCKDTAVSDCGKYRVQISVRSSYPTPIFFCQI
jgi:hypothetical protein